MNVRKHGQIRRFGIAGRFAGRRKMVAESVGPDKGCALIQELKSYGRLNNSSGSLLCNRITVVQAAESRQGLLRQGERNFYLM